MIKYEIKKIPYVEGFVMNEFEYKTVSKSELQSFLKNGWSLHRKKYFIVTNFIDWWKPLSLGNKIAIFAILIPVLMAYFLKNSIDIILFPKSDSELKTINSDSLTTDYNQEVNSDTINYKLIVVKRTDCKLETLVSIDSILVNGAELNSQNFTDFFTNMNPNCSNNAEYSEFNNELIFKTLESNPKNFVAFLSRVSRKIRNKEKTDFVLDELKNPISDFVDLPKMELDLKNTQTEDEELKVEILNSLKIAEQKGK
jgi:hypothetical protein